MSRGSGSPRSDDSSDAFRDDDVEALYERAPCGYLSMTPDGMIVKVNQTFLDWTGYERVDLVDRRSFADLLTAGGRIYHETHYSPMLQMQGRAREIAFDVVCRDGRRLPTLLNSTLERDEEGAGVVVRAAVFEATERRRYERELVAAMRRAESSELRATLLARTLQQTLIPPAVPEVAGLDIAAVYRPAGDGEEIGGDFYDVFQVARDDWVIVIGDVQGKGADAAVVTALARYTIRAAAVQHHQPSDVLRTVNSVLVRDATDRLCTALVLRLRRTGEVWRLTVSTGGHPLPLRTCRGSAPSEVGRPGSLLGFFEPATFHDEEVVLSSGDTIIAYTDGISEARRGETWFGDERIVDALRHHWSSPALLTSRLLTQALAFQADDPRDDIAIVAVHVP